VKPIWPFRHVGLKLVSLALALLLWMAVAGEETVERSLRVPLELQQFPAGLELQGEVPATAEVRVRGTSGALGRVAPGEIVAVLDLRGARPGRRLFHLTPEQVRAPFGIEAVQVVPPTIAMVFEPSESRQVPVVPAVDGKPAPGYVVGNVVSDPPTVEVVGPQSAVARATEAMTEPIEIGGAHDAVREHVTVGLLDPAVRLKTPRAAAVTVEIVPAPLERTLRSRPVRLRGLAAHLSAQASPSNVDVTVRGGRDALAEMDDVAAYVDLSGLGAGDYALPVRADATPDAGVTRIEPSMVQVRVSRAK
jgi:YbbR domain-containing protein